MGGMTPEEFVEQCPVSRETLDRLTVLADLLARWTQRINLVSKSTLPDLWRRHILDSAQLAAHVPPGSRTMVDLGSGAGFPGLVLAAITDLDIHLVESDARKCAFLREAARSMGRQVTVHNTRIEKLPELTQIWSPHGLWRRLNSCSITRNQSVPRMEFACF